MECNENKIKSTGIKSLKLLGMKCSGTIFNGITLN